MIFDRPTLDGIVAGRVDRAYRRWTRPQVKPGGQQRTAVGVIGFGDVVRVDAEAISDADARAAGQRDAATLRKKLARKDGDVWCVAVHLVGADPRVALRNDATIDADARADLDRRLARMDAAADRPWTRAALEAIRDRPAVVSTELAASLDLERFLFKRRVRRLKELGLTESLEVGYRISPRGAAYLTDQ
ncbi:hypothetical protein FE697_011340 [Mumia zhuanghuii]|uniref:ASCH domain-containing protein n=2 Tax=Mumia TaxID=1546255 RepID=A0ABW1QID5_9ACTN|nr:MULTISPECIES: hypothetical protein [Mumia]KAA1422753.1 hypothetical protein FE697_011340 [Mumia zhuanghuii]